MLDSPHPSPAFLKRRLPLVNQPPSSVTELFFRGAKTVPQLVDTLLQATNKRITRTLRDIWLIVLLEWN
jgi:hypothetical protein